MSDPTPQPPAVPLQKLWLAAFYQAIAFLAALVVIVNYSEFGGYQPEWGIYSLWGGMLLILPPAFLQARFRQLLQDTPPSRRNSPEHHKQLQQALMLGVTLSDLPALAGFVHYVLTAEFLVMALYCAASIVLVYMFKPPA
jgi:F0F1-type ATP synthase assembly protein I